MMLCVRTKIAATGENPRWGLRRVEKGPGAMRERRKWGPPIAGRDFRPKQRADASRIGSR